jgi:thymidylate kinase
MAFVVVLGTDHAGKSSALSQLSGRPEWAVVSTDDELLPGTHALISRLKRQMFTEVLPALHDAYSPDFLVALLQTAVIHLRDQIEAGQDRLVVVDSYYYKILAKCRLLLGGDSPMFDWWRTFPRPDAVVFLDVSAESAWRRCGYGARSNPLEYYGDHPSWPEFAAYQRDLRKVLLDEVDGLPVRFIDEQHDVTGVVRRIEEELTSGRF